MPGEPFGPEKTSVLLNLPEPQVPRNKINPEDPKSNCEITELLTHLCKESNKNED
jgi:hypothetical protein